MPTVGATHASPPPSYERRSIRLLHFDYSRTGAYFVTICTRDRMCLFGDIVDGEMLLNDFGRVAHEVWERIPAHFAMVETDAWIVMPNHVHGVIFIAGPDTGGLPSAGTNAGEGVVPRPIRATHASPLQRPSGPPKRSLWRGGRLLQVGRVEANQRIGVVSPYVGVATQLL